MRWWIKLIAAVIAIALLAAAGITLVRAATRVLGNADLSGGVPDPMFSEAPLTVTAPPDLMPEETQRAHGTLDDYVPEQESPVDKTAEQLAREAQAQNEPG